MISRRSVSANTILEKAHNSSNYSDLLPLASVIRLCISFCPAAFAQAFSVPIRKEPLMLSFTDFTQEFVSACTASLQSRYYADAVLEQGSIIKPQLGELTALRFSRPGSTIAPTLYAEDMYSVYKSGRAIADIADEAADVISYSLDIQPDITEADLDLNASAGALRVRLLNKTRNRELLENTAYKDVGSGFVLIADIVKGEFRALISNELVRDSGMTNDMLFELALANSASEGAVLCDLADALPGPCKAKNLLELPEGEHFEDDGSAYVLTNRTSFWGAAALFYPSVMQKLHDLFGDFYVLPSSVHEVLLVPLSAECDPENLARMVREANRTVVEDKDILADDLYACISGEIVRVSYDGEIPESCRCVS